MRKYPKKYILCNYVFLLGLITLFLNDHVFKLAFSNWITGKLSDFIGLLVLPMVLSYVFPKRVLQNVFISGFFFIFWKSPFSEPFIDIYNQIAPIKITRVLDYTDLIALCMLPISYYIINNLGSLSFLQIEITGLHHKILLIPAIIIFMSTSPPYYYRYTFSNGKLRCHKCTKVVKMSEGDLLKVLKENYFVTIDSFPAKGDPSFDYYWKDSIQNLKREYPYYKIDSLIIEKDTITNLQFALQKISDSETKIWINGMDISQEISDQQVEQTLRRYYQKLIKKHLLKEHGKKSNL